MNFSTTMIGNDGSSMLFDSSGAAIQWTSPSQFTILGSASAQGASSAAPLWYAPSASAGWQYFDNIMNLPESVLGALSGIKIYEVMLQAPDSMLTSFFSFIQQHHLKLSVEALPLVASPGQSGYGIESFGAPGDLAHLLSRVKSLGGNLDSVAWDEPWFFGHEATNFYTLAGVAAQVANAVAIVHSLFPNALIGDIEPVSARPGEIAHLASWFEAYKAAVGKYPDFLQADIAYSDAGWQNILASVISAAHSHGIGVSAIVDGLGASTDLTWSSLAVSRAGLLESVPDLRPDAIVVQSWEANPGLQPSASTAGTLASVAADVAAVVASAIKVPAVAVYQPNGLLASVTWASKYSATEDRTTLRFLSPTGTTIASVPWTSVVRFAFDPSNSTVDVVTTGNGVATGYKIAVQSNSFTLSSYTPSAKPSSVDKLFDPAWYGSQHSQALTSGVDLYSEYLTSGWKQGFDPNPFFSTSYYLANNPDVIRSGMNPLLHYELYGWSEGRDPSASFSTNAYRQANPTLPSGTNPLADFLANLRSSDLLAVSRLPVTFSAQGLPGSIVLPSYAAALGAAPVQSAPSAAPPTSTQMAAGTASAAGPAVMRYFDAKTGTQFCTASISEETVLASTRPDLIPEGVAFGSVAADAAGPNIVQVYRLFDTTNGAHFFTASLDEYRSLAATRPDLAPEGSAFEEYAGSTPTNMPVYRYFDTTHGTHLYTSQGAEKAQIDLSRPDLAYEGIAFYAPSA